MFRVCRMWTLCRGSRSDVVTLVWLASTKDVDRVIRCAFRKVCRHIEAVAITRSQSVVPAGWYSFMPRVFSFNSHTIRFHLLLTDNKPSPGTTHQSPSKFGPSALRLLSRVCP
ncbi:unnamed protein product [Mycena citricolor]|uniref:Uncharacterized protein n=1 Tax=Mycena citricolor TaxID=2018698 RepID=A0AAD2GVG1_9AGAR|nr:unnamed protein product [Mycena citricolor]